jgi:hypothetical protein
MFILDIERFFHEAVREAEAVALMRSIGHQQFSRASEARQSITSEFTKDGHVEVAAGLSSATPPVRRLVEAEVRVSWPVRRHHGTLVDEARAIAERRRRSPLGRREPIARQLGRAARRIRTTSAPGRPAAEAEAPSSWPPRRQTRSAG